MPKRIPAFFKILIFILTALFSVSNSSIAQLENPDLPNRKGVKSGPAFMHGAFGTELQFDTNVFLEDKNEKFDVITILSPSAGIELPLRDNSLSFDYEMRANIFGYYNDHSYIDHRVRGLAEINWTDYNITILDVFRHYSDRAGSEDTNRVERQDNHLTAGVKAEFDQLAFDAKYRFNIENFIDDDILYRSSRGDITYRDKDRIANIGELEASYRFLPKTSALLEGDIGFLSYKKPDKSADSWYFQLMGGVRGDLSHRFSADIKAGLRYQSYENTFITDNKDFLGLVAGGSVTYEPTDDDIFILNIERSVYESTFQDMNYYEVNHIGYDYTHYFSNKLMGALFGYYQLNLYPRSSRVGGLWAKRYDHLFGGGVALRYDIRKWVSVEARYELRARRSKFYTFDYIDNLITLRGTVGF